MISAASAYHPRLQFFPITLLRFSFPHITVTPGSATKAAMSRLIIKNLPSYLTPDALRKHFTGQASKNVSSKTFTLTDAKVAYKPDGTSRRFGFVGFKTENEAEEAKQWFDKSFIDSMRISVEVVDVSSSSSYTKCPRFACVSFVSSS